jgi:hypothetical protein
MMFFDNTKPNPFRYFLVVNLGSKIRLISSGLIPIPSTMISTLLRSFTTKPFYFPVVLVLIEWRF